MNLLEAKQHLSRKFDIDYSDIANNGLWTDTDLQVYIQLGVLKAWDYKFWDFSEGSKTAATIQDMTTNGYADYPEDIQSGSIYLLRIGGKEYKKILFQDYLKFFEDDPNSRMRIWSQRKRFIFLNANSYTVGDTLDLYGKLMPPILANPTDLLPFSPDSDNEQHSGNEAVVQMAYAEALDSNKLNNPVQGEAERKKAYQTLDMLWEPFAEERANLQSKNRPFFNVPDYFGGRPSGRSSNFIGNFDYLDFP